jgi:hypothetical protein
MPHELEGLTKFNTDFLDAYCEAELGHTNWAFVEPEDLNSQDIWSCVVFFNTPLPKEET